MAAFNLQGQLIHQHTYDSSVLQGLVPFPGDMETVIVHLYGLAEEGAPARSLDMTMYQRSGESGNLYTEDSIPDYWQQQRFGANNRDALPDADPDHDGQSNFYEFLAGTNPLNPRQFFKPKVVRDSAGRPTAYELPFSARQTFFQLERNETLFPNDWEVMGSEAQGTGNSIVFPITQSENDEAFYRVRLRARE